jgi:ribonuclease E
MMLINGQHAEEVRVAVIDESKRLQTYRVAIAEAGVQRGNIYLGRVASVQPSLDAAFVEYGADKHGFLAGHDVVEQAFQRPAPSGRGHPTVGQVLQKGQPILVQVTRDAMGSKGSVLTTNVSLAGRYLVLMPFEDTRGVSRKVEDEELRRKLKEKAKALVAEDFGFIVRTNAVDQTKTTLRADLDQLRRLWKQVLAQSKEGAPPRLLHDDQDLVVQVLRDHLDSTIDEVLIDDEALLARAESYVAATMPRSRIAVKLYRERLPLFSRHNLEPQIAAINTRSVRLPSGGSIVIDGTEALTAIDVNSGKSTAAESQEETAFRTNLEAAAEVARQLRLRDIGGLVVVDFIDMRSRKHQQGIEKAVRDEMKQDKARSHTSRISANGLMEINRQRVGQALQLRTHVLCPTCQGVGRLVNPDLLALGLLRRIEARAATGLLRRVRVALHPRVADTVQNRRRAQFAALEREFSIQIEIVGRWDLGLSDEEIAWTAAEPPAAVAEPPAAPAEAADEKKATKRRRRRGGRSKKAEAPARSGAAEPAAVAEPAAPAETGDERKTAKRRRRRRSSKKAEAPAKNGAAEPPVAAEPAAAEPAEPAAADPGAAAPTNKRRTRRRPRRRRRPGATPAQDNGGSTPATDPGTQ